MLTFFVTLGVVLIDQLTKLIIRLSMEVGDSFRLIPGVVNITYVQNDGAAFGMLGDARWVFIIVSVAAIAGMVWFLKRYSKRHVLLTLAVSFVLGGGIGNMIDRLFVTDEAGRHVVTDFIEPAFVKFAVFNAADSFITVGAVMLGVYLIFIEPKVEKRRKAQKEQQQDAEEYQNEDGAGTQDGDNDDTGI